MCSKAASAQDAIDQGIEKVVLFGTDFPSAQCSLKVEGMRLRTTHDEVVPRQQPLGEEYCLKSPFSSGLPSPGNSGID